MAHRNGTSQARGSGSGVVLSADGLVLTSAHVVAGSQDGRIELHDGRRGDYQLVGTDPLSDLAVLRTPLDELAPARLGDAERLRVGQLVIAVGSPFGFHGSVSAGVVSAIGRSLPAADGRHVRLVENVIQTDAALHPGNSGGALAISTGEVVGINTAVVGPGIGQGLGLAVPLDRATTTIVGELIAHGRVRRAYLGVAGGSRPLPPRAAVAAGQSHGGEITPVVKDSPAWRAGLRPEEIIIGIGEETVASIGDLQRLMTGGAIGAPVRVRVVRGGDILDVTVSPDELTNQH